jgi:peroxiredoxin
MTLTESTMMRLGTEAPEFELPDTEGNLVSKRDFAGKPLIVMFICNHCPYVKHVAEELTRIGAEYQNKGVGVVAIQSNNIDEYPADAPQLMREEVANRGYTFPYLYDETQQVALSYTAACTPDFFLFDEDHRLAYRGRLDETRPSKIESGVYDSTGSESTGKELRTAIDSVLVGEMPGEKQLPSLGCNIKWKPGNEP